MVYESLFFVIYCIGLGTILYLLYNLCERRKIEKIMAEIRLYISKTKILIPKIDVSQDNFEKEVSLPLNLSKPACNKEYCGTNRIKSNGKKSLKRNLKTSAQKKDTLRFSKKLKRAASLEPMRAGLSCAGPKWEGSANDARRAFKQMNAKAKVFTKNKHKFVVYTINADMFVKEKSMSDMLMQNTNIFYSVCASKGCKNYIFAMKSTNFQAKFLDGRTCFHCSNKKHTTIDKIPMRLINDVLRGYEETCLVTKMPLYHMASFSGLTLIRITELYILDYVWVKSLSFSTFVHSFLDIKQDVINFIVQMEKGKKFTLDEVLSRISSKILKSDEIKDIVRKEMSRFHCRNCSPISYELVNNYTKDELVSHCIGSIKAAEETAFLKFKLALNYPEDLLKDMSMTVMRALEKGDVLKYVKQVKYSPNRINQLVRELFERKAFTCAHNRLVVSFSELIDFIIPKIMVRPRIDRLSATEAIHQIFGAGHTLQDFLVSVIVGKDRAEISDNKILIKCILEYYQNTMPMYTKDKCIRYIAYVSNGLFLNKRGMFVSGKCIKQIAPNCDCYRCFSVQSEQWEMETKDNNGYISFV